MSSILICTWNANGVLGKVGELIHFLNTHNIDILLITETKLTPQNTLKIRGYTIHRQDRATLGRPAGGVAALVKNKIPHTTVHTPHTTLETLAIKLADNTHIITAYNRPSNNFTQHELHTLFSISNKCLLAGDFNACHISWGCNRNNDNGTVLRKYLDSHNINIQYTDIPTHYPPNGSTPNPLDLILYQNLTNVTKPEALAELSSDHIPVTFYLENQKTDDDKIFKISYKNTDWDEFKKTLDTHITINKIHTTQDLEDQVQNFTKAIQKTIKKHTNTIKIKPNKDKLADTTLELIKKRNKTRRLWQATQDTTHRDNMNTLNRLIKTEIKVQRNKTWNDRLTKLKPNDNSLWKMTKTLKRKGKPMPALTHNNATLLTDEEKAEAIAGIFESVHKIDTNNTVEQTHISNTVKTYVTQQHEYTISAALTTKPSEVAETIKTLPNGKAPGPDGIPNTVLKHFTRKSLSQLTNIINATIRLKHFPTSWKTATVVPILKPNKKPTDATSYRPISLLNTLSKLTEKILLKRINKENKKRKIIPDFQFGFRPGHSTTQQIARLVTDIIGQFNKSKVTVMTLLDFEKAFDRVWIDGLIYKLIKLNYNRTLILLLYSYLTDRKFQTKIHNTYSTQKSVRAGVAQGSVLGPVLYTMYLCDMPTFPQTKLAVFADDTALYAHSYYAEVAKRQIQIHINMLQEYWAKWKLGINAEKTELITFTRKFTNTTIKTPLTIHQQKITPSPTNTIKYLGMTLDKTLSFNAHVTKAIQKTHSVIKNIYPLLVKNSALTPRNKKLLYTTLLRPTLTYAAPVWCGMSDTSFTRLQRLQNKCLRLVANADRYIKITRLHEITDTPYIQEYIRHLAQNFYTNIKTKNPLITNITHSRIHNTPTTHKHKLPYQKLPIYRVRQL